MEISEELKAMASRLSVSNPQFSELIEDGGIYVDKTQYIELLVRGRINKYYFLSRPRRFGKSLLLDTIGSLFEGREELFRGLYIHDKWDWSQKYPVVRLDLSDVGSKKSGGIENGLLSLMREVFLKTHKLAIDETQEPRFIFKDAIMDLSQRENSPLVLLIDEYDVPILSKITNHSECDAAKQTMHDFYHIVKKMGSHIRFIMFTGITKFAGINIFSALNNLVDISLKPEFSAICGYTESEIENYFYEYIKPFDRDRFREMYNGYNWLGEPVYNPVDAMKAFDWGLTAKSLNKLPYFWYKTGTPTFLAEVMKEKGLLIPNLGPDGMLEDVFSEISIDDLSPEALLFQAGYLTIGEEVTDDESDEIRYRLKYPNKEVQRALNRSFLKYILGNKDGKLDTETRKRLNRALLYADFNELYKFIHEFFAGLSHRWYTNNKNDSSEGYYCAVVFALLATICDDLEAESQTNKGQLDIYASRRGKKYIFEIKVREKAKGKKGIDQILEKGYAEKYIDEGELYLVGVEFSSEARNIVELEYCCGVDGERTKIPYNEEPKDRNEKK